MKITTRIKKIAEKHDWEFLCYQENIGMISFWKNKSDRINIYTTTMTVSTSINHPKKGKTQLFRKLVDFDELNIIFQNPRVHTDKGYYTK